ncbi:MAG TPA: tetratricopeptide repeat protein [Chthoniobacterales bacterium]
MRSLSLAWLLLLFPIAGIRAEKLSPEVLARYEEILIKNPNPGPAFDKVYLYYLEAGNLAELSDKWAKLAAGRDANAASYELLLGLLEERRGNGESAARHFETHLAASPASAPAWTALARLAARKPDLAKAAEAYRRAIPLTSNTEDQLGLYRELALLYERNFQADQAIQVWKEVAAAYPDDPVVMEEAASAFAEAGKQEEARQLLDGFLKNSSPGPAAKLRLEMLAASLLEKSGKRAEALAEYEKLLEDVSPKSWLQRELRSRIETSFRQADDLPGLAQYYETRLKTHPNEVESAMRLSNVDAELGKSADALNYIRQASEWAPEDMEIKLVLASRLTEAKQEAEAEKRVGQWIQQNPERKELVETLARIQWAHFKRTGEAGIQAQVVETLKSLVPADKPMAADYSKCADLLSGYEFDETAAEFYEKALAMDPQSSDTIERLGRSRLKAKQPEKAWGVLEGLTAKPNAEASDYVRLARLQEPNGKVNEAIQTAAKGIEKYPDSLDLLNLSYQLLTREKRMEEALAMLDQLIARVPSNAALVQAETQKVSLLQNLKKAEGEEGELRARLENGETLSEPEFRLLLRLQSALDRKPEAALAAAEKTFPDSLPLLQLRMEVARKSGNTGQTIALLKKLAERDSEQRQGWLQEVANSYQKANQPDQALQAARDVIAAFPAKPDGYLFAGNLALQMGKFDEAAGWYTQAAGLSEKPRDPLSRLARLYFQRGNYSDAIRVYEEAFEAESEPEGRVAILGEMVNPYLLSNRIDELIQRFKKRQEGESEDGWRYALYLSQLYLRLNDYPSAREQLIRVYAARPNDARMVRQIIRISEQENNPKERSKYWKRLLELEPTPANQLQFSQILFAEDRSGEALQLLEQNAAEWTGKPEVFYGLVSAIKKPAAAKAALELWNRKTGRSEVDAFEFAMNLLLESSVLPRKEFDEKLWSIVANPPPVLIPPPSKNQSPVVFYLNSMMALSQSSQNEWLQRRIFLTSLTLQLRQLVMSRKSGGGSFVSFSRQQPLPSPSEKISVRDYALAWAVATTAESAAEAEVASRAQAALASSDAPPEEKLFVQSLLGMNEPFFKLVEDYVNNRPANPELDFYCLSVLASGKPVEGVENALLKQFTERVAARNPKDFFSAFTLASACQKLGDMEKARAIFKPALGEIDLQANPQMNIAFAAYGALKFDAVPAFKDFLARVRANPNLQSPSPYMDRLAYLLSWTYQFQENNESLPDSKQMLALTRVLLEDYFNRKLSPISRAQMNQGFFGFGGSNLIVPTKYFDASDLAALNTVFERARAAGVAGEMMEMVNQLEPQVPANQKVAVRLLATVMLSWVGKKEESAAAARKLLEETSDADIRLVYAKILAQAGKNPEAIAILQEIKPIDGQTYRCAQFDMLAASKITGDKALSEKMVAELSQARLSPQERQILSNYTGQPLRSPASGGSTSANPGISLNEQVNQLYQLAREEKTDEAMKLADQIFANDLVSKYKPDEWNPAEAACGALNRMSRLIGQIRAWEKQLEAAPDSQRLLFLIATGYGITGAADTSHYTKDGFSSPLWLKIQREGEVFRGSLSRDGRQWEVFKETRLNLPAKTYIGLAVTAHTDAKLATAEFQDVTWKGAVEPAEGVSPETGWAARDIGRPKIAGKEVLQDGKIWVSASGEDIFRRKDRFHYVYRTLTGDGEMIARVNSLDRTSEWSKAGVMIREGLGQNDANIMMTWLAEGSASLQWRQTRDKALDYWQRLAELRNQDPIFNTQIAKALRTQGRDEEALAVYRDVIKRDPEMIVDEPNEMIQLFEDAGKLDELITIEFPPANPQGRSVDVGWYFECLSDLLIRKERKDEAVRALQQGLKLSQEGRDAYRRGSLTLKLIEQYLAQERKDEAKKLLLEMFEASSGSRAPTRRQSNSLLGSAASFGSYGDFDPFFSSIGSSDDGLPSSDAQRYLELAKTQGWLKEAREIVAASAKADVSEKNRFLALALRAMERDASVVLEVAQLGREPFDSAKAGDFQTQGAIALCLSQLLRWPATQSAALDWIQRIIDSPDDAQGNTPFLKNALAPWKFRLDAVRGILSVPPEKLLGNFIVKLSGPQGQYNAPYGIILPCWNGLIAKENYAECERLLATVSGLPANFRGRFDMKKLARMREELKFYKEGGNAVAILWLTLKEGRLELRWAFKPVDESKLTPAFPGRRASSNDGKYTLKILAGPNPKELKEAADLPAVKSMGKWSEKLPAETRFVRADLVAADGKITPGPVIPIVPPSGNLLKNPTFKELPKDLAANDPKKTGWNCGSDGWWLKCPNSLTSNGSSMLFATTSRGRDQAEIVANRVKIDPTQNYLLAARFGSPGGAASGAIGVRFFDEAGNSVDNVSVGASATQGCQQVYQLFAPGEGARTINAKARFAEVYFRISGLSPVGDVYFGSPPAEAKINEPAKPKEG